MEDMAQEETCKSSATIGGCDTVGQARAPTWLKLRAIKHIDLLSGCTAVGRSPFKPNFPVGSEQHFTPSLHFSSVPKNHVRGWFALEDVVRLRAANVLSEITQVAGYTRALWQLQADPKLRLQEQYETAWEILCRPWAWEKGVPSQEGPGLDRTQSPAGELITSTRTRPLVSGYHYIPRLAYIAPVHSDALLGRIAFKNVVDLTTTMKLITLHGQ